MGLSIWERAEEAGHDFTLVSGLSGTSTYYCECCAALMIVGQSPSEPEVFHAPRVPLTVGATLDRCPAGWLKSVERLKDKLDAMNARDLERLRSV
jgi:hypothetical protein